MADDGSKTAPGTCAHCRKPAVRRCTGCVEAPVYAESASEPTFYCDSVCQRANRAKHKSECGKLQLRKTLARAAIVLQAIIYRIRLHASPLQFESMRVQGTTIYLDRFQPSGLDPQRQLKPFPTRLNGNRSHLEAVLVLLGCTEAMMYLHVFTEELLAGKPTQLSTFLPWNPNPKLRISLGLPAGYQVAPNSFHNLYRVILKNGETWAVDTTGAQFGHVDPLCPWNDFVRHRSSKINREHEFGYIRHRTYQSFGTFPMRYMVAQKIEKQKLTQALEEKIPALAEEHGGKLNTILRGSDAAFSQAKDRFLNKFEDHLRMSMSRMYAPEQITRRSKEIDCQLSQNMADPDKQKELEGLTKFTVANLAFSRMEV